ncbi:MAG: phosphoribosylpyrophosphate synthetase, partial [Brevundimonas sp.]|nr:phosphoribosylpyrophosphate synthetase [Brevundimonas sp.]
LIDDIIDSGGTLCNAAGALMDAGAKSVTAYLTHGVLSGSAVERVNGSALKELVITDSIQATDAARDSDKVRILPIAPLIGEAIRRIADESSVSSLFD